MNGSCLQLQQHCTTPAGHNGQCTAECRLQGDWRKWPSSPEVNKHSVVHTTDVPGGRTNLVHFSYKICCLVAAVSTIFTRINWPKFNFLKLILRTIISLCSLSSIKESATTCSLVLTSHLDHRSLDTHY